MTITGKHRNRYSREPAHQRCPRAPCCSSGSRRSYRALATAWHWVRRAGRYERTGWPTIRAEPCLCATDRLRIQTRTSELRSWDEAVRHRAFVEGTSAATANMRGTGLRRGRWSKMSQDGHFAGCRKSWPASKGHLHPSSHYPNSCVVIRFDRIPFCSSPTRS